MAARWTLSVLTLGGIFISASNGQRACPTPKSILPCRCLLRGDEYQIWCTHSDLPSVLEGLRATARFIKEPIDELILENNYLPSLPGRAFTPLKIIRLMLRYNGLESVSDYWLGDMETTLMELFIVEPKLRIIPNESLRSLISLQAVTIQTNLMKRLPMFSGLPKLRYVQIESTALLELSPNNFKDNPALEKLYIGQCPNLNRLDAGSFIDLPSLALLNISHCGITWMHHRALTRLPLLKELVLTSNRFRDAGLIGRVVRELPQLEILRLDNNLIDILNEAAFVDLPSLRELHLANNRIIEMQRGAFHRVPKLKKLNLNENFLRRVHPESFLPESRIGLEELWLIGNEINHVADLRAILDALPRLVFLDMSHNHLEVIPYGSLRGHPTLEHLNLDYNRLHLIDREAIVSMPALRELRLRNNSLSNTMELPLWILPELRGLDLSNNFLRRLEPRLLQDLPSLRKLDVSNNQLVYVDPAAFVPTPALENINISFNNLATIHPATFRSLLGLYELDLSNNLLMEFVPGLPRGIEYLHLRYNDIITLPPAPTPDLDLPVLKMLDLSSNKILSLPKSGLATLPQLRKLLIGRNQLKIIEDGSFKGLTKLETLDASANSLALIGVDAFRFQPELRNLDLGFNKLEFLPPECLHYCVHLKMLNLTRNMLTDLQPGTLDKNKKLQFIDLSGNKFKQLPATFIGLKNLRTLDLNKNEIDAVDPDILRSLPSLKILKLSGNNIKDVRENGFSKLQHLTTLELEENDLEVIESNSIKGLPVLTKIKLNRNKIKQIADMAFVNLPSLQMVELQENEINFIAPTAFVDTPHLLMLNLSHNQIPSLDVSGLTGAKSLEMLDASHNLIASVASASLEKMEWLVELRLDDNRICGVHGSPFNHMPRLRVLSMRNNKIMSFSERAVEKIRSNIAVLDIAGNPLSCSCNMLWMQAWLFETSSVGPRCADGYLLTEHKHLKQDCTEDERNVEIVAPGCESELLSAPGVFSPPKTHSSLMNMNKALNTSNDRNSLAPTPEQSDYFYDDYVDFPDNETNEALTTPPPYELEEKKIESKDSSTKGLLGGFGIPLLQIANIVQSVVDATRKQRIPPEKTDRMAIVTKPIGDVIEKYPAPNFPKFETGGFVPMLPGSEGGFKPIVPPSNLLPFKPSKGVDSSNVASSNVLISTTTTRPLVTEPSTLPPITTLPPSTTTVCLDNGIKKKLPPNKTERKSFNKTSMYLVHQFYDSDNDESMDSTTQQEYSDLTTSLDPTEQTTRMETTTLQPAITKLEPVKQSLVRNDKAVGPRMKFLVPADEPPPPRHVGKVTKLSSSEVLESTSANTALPITANYNREPKEIAPGSPIGLVASEHPKNDITWYFETYNNTPSNGARKKSHATLVNVDYLLFVIFMFNFYNNRL